MLCNIIIYCIIIYEIQPIDFIKNLIKQNQIDKTNRYID